MHVNLIPLELRLRMIALRLLRRWTIVAVVLATAGLFATVVQFRFACISKNEMASLKERARPLTDIQKQTALLQVRLHNLQSEQTLLQSIERADHSLALMQILSSAAKSVGEPLQIQQMRLRNEPPAYPSDKQNQPAEDKPTAPLSTITLQGVAASDLGLARFVDALRRSPPLQQVELKSSSQWQSEALNARQFQVECRFAE